MKTKKKYYIVIYIKNYLIIKDSKKNSLNNAIYSMIMNFYIQNIIYNIKFIR
jgi:hypothetical protein